ncbi:MAG: glycosyl hydrolase [Alistipes sp.]
MKLTKLLLITLSAILAASSTFAGNLPTQKPAPVEANLYQIFQNPDCRHRPYVRWWWNGSRVDEKEILRELDLMKQAGIGGVEINTIQFPDQTDSVGYAALPWLSDEWVRMVNVAVDGCEQRGMVCDIIVGSGWPFGAEFLTPDEQIQQLFPVTIDVKGGKFNITKEQILAQANSPISHALTPKKELMFMRLLPKQVTDFTAGVSYDQLINKDNISIEVPEGDYVLYCFVKLTGYMKVIVGAPGASGPVVNHLDSKAVEHYLNRFSEKMNFMGGTLKGRIRAAFCDSFELEGDNWDSKMLAEFEKRTGYSLLPYLPYVIRKVGSMGEPIREPYGSVFSKQVTQEVIERVRNDYEHVQIELFQENFIDTYNKWCHRNGLKSRIQAYGRQLHPIESSMYIDIPECESWIHDHVGRTLEPNQYLSGRGYSMSNKFTSSGAFLSGKNIVSCEEQTNVGDIFQTTLEEIKVTGDRSNLSGVNHSILHGFNYSPKQKDFLGWIQFGTYFSENNTWWPYLRMWTDYKARLSALLQNSIYQADIAILSPHEDLWSIHGQQRDPYPGVTYPNYANDLWEAVQQSGNGCDYVSEQIIQQASVVKGELRFGQRAYKTLLLMEVESMNPKTARMLASFVAKGGRVICIGKTPHQSVGRRDVEANSAEVKATIGQLLATYPDRFIRVDSPGTPILGWYQDLQKQYNLTPYAKISQPDKYLMLNYYKSGKRDIYFIANTAIEREQNVKIEFPAHVAKKQAWIWNAETGERHMLATTNGTLDLRFPSADAKVIVFENDRSGEFLPATPIRNANPVTLNGTWDVRATHHVEKTVKEFRMAELVDLHSLPFPWLRSFAGTLEYSQQVNVADPSGFHTLDAGLTHHGVTELFVNGKSVGVKWYGERTFDISGKLVKGENTITLKVTTLLGDYVKSRMHDTPTAKRWEWAVRINSELGLRGPVVLY